MQPDETRHTNLPARAACYPRRDILTPGLRLLMTAADLRLHEASIALVHFRVSVARGEINTPAAAITALNQIKNLAGSAELLVDSVAHSISKHASREPERGIRS